MIASAKRMRQMAVSACYAKFLSLLPTIRDQARFAFRTEKPERRQELIAEVVANCWVAFVRLVERGLLEVVYPTPLSDQTEAGLEIRSLVKTKTPKIEFHAYPARTDAHFRRLFAVIREYLDALDAGRFNYRPGLHCGMCDFATSHCREWCG